MTTKIYVDPESTVTWRNTGGTELFTCTSLATVSGRQGAYHDFGTAARPQWGRWRAWLKPGATRVVGEIIEVYWITSDGTIPDNDDGTGDIAVSAKDKLRNLQPIGFIQIDENAAVTMVARGEQLDLSHRWGAPAFWNATANTLSATAGDFGFDLTPTPDEIQA